MFYVLHYVIKVRAAAMFDRLVAAYFTVTNIKFWHSAILEDYSESGNWYFST
jgi:hypothetical protein